MEREDRLARLAGTDWKSMATMVSAGCCLRAVEIDIILQWLLEGDG
jgi:hypothetical protein